MKAKLTQVIEMVNYWVSQSNSQQKTTVLKYWITELKRFAAVSYTTNGKSITIGTPEKKLAFKELAKFYGVPAKVKGETVSDQSFRLVVLDGRVGVSEHDKAVANDLYYANPRNRR